MMTSKKNNMLRNGVLAGLATMLMAFGVGCGEDEPEERCEEGEIYLLIGDNEPQCYTQCTDETADDVCAEGQECRGSGEAQVCRAPAGDPDPPETGECDAQTVCESYCEARFGACVDEHCGGNADVRAQELEWCLEGQTLQGADGQPVEISEGCLAEAAVSEAACEQLEAEAEQLTTAGCSGDAGKAFVCSQLGVFNAQGGDVVYNEQCGCESAPIGGECTTDEDCSGDSYEGRCITPALEESAPASGYCIAFCDGDGSLYNPDLNCGSEGGYCSSQSTGSGTVDICQKECLEPSDCGTREGEETCAPSLFGDQGGSIVTFGACTIAGCDPGADVTGCEENTASDNLPAATACHPFGFCTQPCTFDEADEVADCPAIPLSNEASVQLTCAPEGFCEYPWAEAAAAE